MKSLSTKMSDKEKVLSVYPEAYCTGDVMWYSIASTPKTFNTDGSLLAKIIGSGGSVEGAWSNAAQRITNHNESKTTQKVKEPSNE